MKEHPGKVPDDSRAEFVIAADPLAAMGLACLMKEAGKRVTCIPAGECFHLLPMLRQQHWQLTVFMPADPLGFLRTIDRVVMLIKCSYTPPHIIILSHAPAGWIVETLSAQGCTQSMLCNITVLPSRINCRQLFMMISGTVRPSLFRFRADHIGSLLPVLTPREYTAVYSWLAGYSSHAFAEKANRSVKTFYGQRYSGLCKLASVFPFLKPRRRVNHIQQEQKRDVKG